MWLSECTQYLQPHVRGIVAAYALRCKHSETSKLVHVDAKGHKWFIVKSSKSELKTRPVIHSVNFMEPS